MGKKYTRCFCCFGADTVTLELLLRLMCLPWAKHIPSSVFFLLFFSMLLWNITQLLFSEMIWEVFFPILSKIRLDLKACGITIQFLTTSNSETWLRQYQAKRCTEVKSADWLNMHSSDLVEETDYCVRAWKKCFHSHTSKAFAFMCQFLQKPFRFFVVFF